MFHLAAILITFLLPLITDAQTITAAPILTQRQPLSPGELQARSNTAGGLESCDKSVPGCSVQVALFDKCTSSYGTTDPRNLYCLCTNGYYSAVHSCDACYVKAGVYSTGYLSTEISLDNAECASLSNQYGSGESSLTNSDGITLGSGSGGTTDSATATTGHLRTSNNGPASTAMISPSTPIMSGLPEATFALTLDGSPTGTLPSIQSVSTTTQANSSARNANISIDTWAFFVVTCFASIGWSLGLAL